MEEYMIPCQISVRSLVEFVYQSGDLVSTSSSYERANLGSQIHRMIQSQRGPDYQEEVSIKKSYPFKGVQFHIEGRIDGVFTEGKRIVIEEIKSTYLPYESIDDTNIVHFAQCYIYAFLYLLEHQLKSINVQLTYYAIESKQEKIFRQNKRQTSLKKFFEDTLRVYVVWAKLQDKLKKQTVSDLQKLQFPFQEYRNHQRKFAVSVYSTIVKNEDLYIQAPTGIGKTISTIFPSLKACGEQIIERIFYLCAKNITSKVAIDTIRLLYQQQGKFKTSILYAKDKICMLETRDCDPEICPYAKGYYDRLKKALSQLLTKHHLLDKEVLIQFANQYTLCPFELSLDASLYATFIICDYNYAFDPRVFLKRFFSAPSNSVLLIDEAHNLIERGKQMFSAKLSYHSFKILRKKIKNDRKLQKSIDKIIETFYILAAALKDKRIQFYQQPAIDDQNFQELWRFIEKCNQSFQEKKHQEVEELKNLFFEVLHFTNIYEHYYDESFTCCYLFDNDDFKIELCCLNPHNALKKNQNLVLSSIFFSATLTPFPYYQSMLGQKESTQILQLPSIFSNDQTCVMIANQISTRYVDRDQTLIQIIELIHASIAGKNGNYIVYAPSYVYLRKLHDQFQKLFPSIMIHLQASSMLEEDKQTFLAQFHQLNEQHLYFCVLGGMFAEGIDLKQDQLIGVIIIGVGLPQVNPYQNMIKDHFDQQNHMGFAYAYQFPGMNKVAQAAGRLIRDMKDRGILLFIDSRYKEEQYIRLLPAQYKPFHVVHTPQDITQRIQNFWQKS